MITYSIRELEKLNHDERQKLRYELIKIAIREYAIKHTERPIGVILPFEWLKALDSDYQEIMDDYYPLRDLIAALAVDTLGKPIISGKSLGIILTHDIENQIIVY